MAFEPTITNSYSMDIIIKICGTLATFIVFMFISAWHLTRKKYKLPQFIKATSPLKNIRDLTSLNFLITCYKLSRNKPNYGSIAAPFAKGKMAIIINDINWCFYHKPNLIFTVPFSLVPKCITKSWQGILFSQDSTEAEVLRCLVVKGFESVDWCVLNKSIDFGIRYNKDLTINVDASAQLISFESIMGYSVDSEKLESKLVFITKIVNLIDDFTDYFYDGELLNKALDEDNPGASGFTEIVNRLLNPVIESALFHSDSQYSTTIPVSAVSENILSQIAKLRHHIRKENVDCNLLTIDHFSHVIFEHNFILTVILRKSLQGIQYLISSSPEIIRAIKNEILHEISVENGKSMKLLEYYLEASTSLVYTKSVAQELIRHLAVGIEFDLSITERDGSVGNLDLLENSVIVLNHLAFSRDKCCHINSIDDAEYFRPGRFIKYNSSEQKYFFYNSEKLVSFQDQWHVVGLPRNFICRILLVILIKIATPGHVMDMNCQANGANNTQYELLYDLNTKFKWDWNNLADI